MKISKSLVFFLLFLFSSTVAFANQPQISNIIPGNVYIPKGTVIKTELITPVNSGKNNVNDVVLFKTTESVVINGVEIIPLGTTGEAIVSKIRKAGAWGKGGKIELTAKSIKTINGIEVPLTLDVQKSGGGANMVLGVLAIGIFSGFLHGANQDIPAGTKFQVAVESDIDLGATDETLAETIHKYKPVIVTLQSADTSLPYPTATAN